MNPENIERLVNNGLVFENDVFKYEDKYSKLFYELVETKNSKEEIPILALFTAKPEETSYTYQGIVSHLYHFEGNENIIKEVIGSLNEENTEIIEKCNLNSKLTVMLNEMIIRNNSFSSTDGDVHPMITILNSYNGTNLVKISFGFSILRGDQISNTLTMRKSFGTIDKIHIKGSVNRFFDNINNYIQIMSGNLLSLIEVNMEKQINEETLLQILDIIDSLGKKRRNQISSSIDEIRQNNNNIISSWDLFIALTKFTTNEGNLNAKILLENIVERFMVIPNRMLEFIESQKNTA